METLEIVISVTVVSVVLFLMIIGFFMTRSPKRKSWNKEVLSKLHELTILSSNADTVYVKNAIMEADKLLDFALERNSVQGDTLGEKLGKAQNVFTNKENLERAWNGHKVRNSLAHDINFRADTKQLREAFSELSAGIKDLST
jgi:hypothetical protein